MKYSLQLLALTATLFALALLVIQYPPTPFPTLSTTANLEKTESVILGFDTPHLDQLDDDARMAAIAQEREALLARLEKQRVPFEILHTYEYLALVTLNTTPAGLAMLTADPAVTFVEENDEVDIELFQSVNLIRADYNHIAAYTGAGQTIAIIDSGVDRFHPDLAGRVVSGACYSTPDNSISAVSTCPGGASSSTNINSSGPCLNGGGCDHGTHVAATAVGVAPDANIIAIQVFRVINNQSYCTNLGRTSPCITSTGGDIIAALNRVYALRNTYNIASVNMSLGSGQFTSATACNNANNAYRTATDLVRSANIAVVATAGNRYYRNAMGSPGCITGVISVAASDKNDAIGAFSNIANYTTLFAPGVNIYAAVPGTGNPPPRDYKSGTSMAAPHVAGVIALLRQARSNATLTQINTALTSTGPFITDNRPPDPNRNQPAGSVTKRRLDAFLAVCSLITCDADDFRVVGINQTLNGSINPASDVDNYYFFGQAGDRITVSVNRTSGTVNPFVELYSPNNNRVAFNANGGGGSNALINGYLLPQSGRYVIRIRGVVGTGNYQLQVTSNTVPLNPVPSITSLSPSAATATPFGSDFWVAIYGQGFLPDSQVRWNGQLRSKFYSSPNLIYIRVRGSDINVVPLPPRLAFISVRNPAPGGGTSANYPFSVRVPFLGESELVSPSSGTSFEANIQHTIVMSWTHPTDSWRTMQRMDMRLRDPDSGAVALWLRVVERPNDPEAEFPSSTFRLMEETAGSVPPEEEDLDESPREGVPGAGPDLVMPGVVTVHMAESAFAGSGRTAVMTATVSFDPAMVGQYNIEFEVDSETPLDEFGNLQKDDVLGIFYILPAGCPTAVDNVYLSGPGMGLTDTEYSFTTAVMPINATTPFTYTWSPTPLSGQGTDEATYRWSEAGQQVVEVAVENCGGFGADYHTIDISTGPNPDLAIVKMAPATAVVGQPFTYTLTITNSGAMTATNLLVRDMLPSGATHLSGGMVMGNEVQWNISELPGFGHTAVVSFTASAMSDVVNNDYSVTADGGYMAENNAPIHTRIVDAQVKLTPVMTRTLSYSHMGQTSQLRFPGGSVFADTIVTYDELSPPPNLGDLPYHGRAFQLDAYQDNNLLTDYQLYATAYMTISYSPTQLEMDGVNPNALTLSYWADDAWQNEGVSCTTSPSQATVTCAVEMPRLTTYLLSTKAYTLYLPLAVKPQLSARITGISMMGTQYAVNFQTYGYTPAMPGQHVHFFFDTVPPAQAGVPGSGPWKVYAGPSPFTEYGPADRPPSATQLCILVANPDHSVIQGTGNCYSLP